MNYETALLKIDTAIENGTLMRLEIEVDGQRVRYQSIQQIMALREWLVRKIGQSDTSNPYRGGRIPIGNPGDGLE